MQPVAARRRSACMGRVTAVRGAVPAVQGAGSVCLDVINQTWSPMFDLVNVFETFLPQASPARGCLRVVLPGLPAPHRDPPPSRMHTCHASSAAPHT